MPPIEDHLRQRLSAEFAALGLNVDVKVLSAEAHNWRYRVRAGGRDFELGFDRLESFWAREVTLGRAKHLTSNDHRPPHRSTAARQLGVRLIAAALRAPGFPPRDPPVI